MRLRSILTSIPSPMNLIIFLYSSGNCCTDPGAGLLTGFCFEIRDTEVIVHQIRHVSQSDLNMEDL
jgi:hypothetical protein